MTAPPTCVCSPDDHFGMLLHPLFPHVHGDDHQIMAGRDEPQSDRSVDIRSAQQVPGISAGSTDMGGREALTGLLVPFLLAAAIVEISRRLRLVELQPEQRTLAPPLPPPRIALTLA